MSGLKNYSFPLKLVHATEVDSAARAGLKIERPEKTPALPARPDSAVPRPPAPFF